LKSIGKTQLINRKRKVQVEKKLMNNQYTQTKKIKNAVVSEKHIMPESQINEVGVEREQSQESEQPVRHEKEIHKYGCDTILDRINITTLNFIVKKR